jgi:hypothetical protein
MGRHLAFALWRLSLESGHDFSRRIDRTDCESYHLLGIVRQDGAVSDDFKIYCKTGG